MKAGLLVWGSILCSSCRVLEIVFASLSMLTWVLRSAFRYVFVTLWVRIVLYCSGVILYKFEVLSGKVSRLSDDLILFMSSMSFFWKSFLTVLKLIDGIISYRSLSNGDNSSCCGGVKFDLNPKFVLFTECSFLSKNCAFHLNLVIKLLTFSIILFE